jgi:excisionase family DNA binding protein
MQYDLTRESAMQKTEKRLLTVAEAATLLCVQPSTVRSWLLHRKHIGKVRIGTRAVRILAADVERLIQEGTIPARVR